MKVENNYTSFEPETIELMLTNAGFKVFGDKIVAADLGQSGLATKCAIDLIRQVELMLLAREAT